MSMCRFSECHLLFLLFLWTRYTLPDTMAHHSHEEIYEFQEAFSLYEREDGTIPTTSLEGLMRALAVVPTQQELLELIHKVDPNASNTITFDQFLSVMSDYKMRHSRVVEENDCPMGEEEIKDMFRMFDKDGDGYISPPELRLAMARLGERMTDAQLDDMFKEADLNGDGRIDFQDITEAQADDSLCSLDLLAYSYLITEPEMAGQGPDEQELQQVFAMVDKNSDGTVSAQEMKTLMESLGLKHSEDDIRALMKKVDIDRNNSISFQEFVTMIKAMKPTDSEKQLLDQFRLLDKDGNGLVSIGELKEQSWAMGLEMTKAELEDLMRERDLDGDGKLSFEEFKKLMTS